MNPKQFTPEPITKDLTNEQADIRGVLSFSQAMNEKLTYCRTKRGNASWHLLDTIDPFTKRPNTVEQFKKSMQVALNEGRMVDIANYAMIIYHRERMENE